jgi:hypothetical protein
MVKRFHVGQRVRLKRRLATQPPGLFPKGATGTVANVGGVGPLDGEIPVWVKMDQHFLHLAHEDNQLLVKSSEIADAAKGRWARLWATWRGE